MRSRQKVEVDPVEHIPNATPDEYEADDDAEITCKIAQRVFRELLAVTHVIHTKSVAWRGRKRCDTIAFIVIIWVGKPM